MLDAVILSDLHINAHNCQAKALAAFLDRIRHEDVRTVRLILNGDVFDHFDKRVRRGNWEVLSDLRRLSDRLEVVWVKGNHDDTGPAETVAHLIGATFCPNHYTFSSGDKTVAAIHGHQFDQFIAARPILTWVGSRLYDLSQRIGGTGLARWLKHSSKAYLRNAEAVKAGALRFAAKHEYDLVLCGHTHRAEESPGYANSGCWTEHPCTYLAVAEGRAEIKTFLFEK